MNRQNDPVRFTFVILAIVLTVSAMFIAVACGSGGGTTTSATTTVSPGVSYSRDIQPLFNNYCVVCHQGAGQAGLTLEPNLSYSKLVGVPSTQHSMLLLVRAGSPDQSYLLAKLKGTQIQVGGVGVQMPYGAAPLQQSQINIIQQWIEAGAMEN